MNIQFLPNSIFDPITMSVCFNAIVEGKRKRIIVSQETLQDHFGANNNPNLVAVFEANRQIIQRKAVQLIEAGIEGDVIIKTSMFANV
ncbi:DUF1488 family protein [Polynucleobacter sp. P1-05-14]|uniref:DUF1488 family protein n=1 Tax=Polynucleobacter sp. P1-05-14 TaxID=1819732 RepID=UPI001C0B2F8F|nr:DUF1488 family protein [Polynucleobacter sp. P1-05-14]MBU3548244.1 DUF1488 domain-containing protein [Polynucleobacter sp. P1-05-14]